MMFFNVRYAYDQLVLKGIVYTVRITPSKRNTDIAVRGNYRNVHKIGRIGIQVLKKISSKQCLEPFVDRSGFKRAGTWWNTIQRMHKNPSSLWLHCVTLNTKFFPRKWGHSLFTSNRIRFESHILYSYCQRSYTIKHVSKDGTSLIIPVPSSLRQINPQDEATLLKGYKIELFDYKPPRKPEGNDVTNHTVSDPNQLTLEMIQMDIHKRKSRKDRACYTCGAHIKKGDEYLAVRTFFEPISRGNTWGEINNDWVALCPSHRKDLLGGKHEMYPYRADYLLIDQDDAEQYVSPTHEDEIQEAHAIGSLDDRGL